MRYLIIAVGYKGEIITMQVMASEELAQMQADDWMEHRIDVATVVRTITTEYE